MKNKVLYVLGIVVAVLVIGGTVFFIGGGKEPTQATGGLVSSTPAIEEVVTDNDVNVQTPDVSVEKFEWEDRETCIGVQIKIIEDCLAHSEPRNASDMLEGLTTGTVLDVTAEVYQNNEFIGWVKTAQGYVDLDNAEWVIVDAAEFEEETTEAPASTEEAPIEAPVEEPEPTEAPVEEPVEEPEPTEAPIEEPVPTEEPVEEPVPTEEPVVEPTEPIEPEEPKEPEKPAPTPVPKKEEPVTPPAPVDNGDDFMSQLIEMGIIIDDSNVNDGVGSDIILNLE